MQETNQKKNKILAAIAVALLLVIAFFLGADTVSKNNKSPDVAIEKEIKKFSVSLVIIDGDKIRKEYNLNDIVEQTTVFDILNNNAEVEYNNNYDFGVFIESIGGIKNGDDGKYWQYYVNDALGDVAADKKNLSNGDVVEWRFEEVPF